MVRIVSGQRSDPNEALLQGMELGKGFRQAQMARQQAKEDQMNQALRMQEIQMRFQDARAKREQALAQAAQMGDVRALQQMSLEAQIPESDKMGRAALQTLSGITDPDAREEAMQAFKPLIELTRKKEREQALEAGLQDALKDGLIDETGVEAARTRVASGEEPEKILQEFATVRFKNAKAATAVQENAKFLEQAKMLAESAPTPEAKRKAMIPLAVYEQSPASQEKPGSGARMLEEVMKAANAGRDEQIAAYVKQRTAEDFLSKLSEGMKARQDQFGEQITPTGKGYGQNVFPSDEPFEQPRTPAMQTHIEGQRAAKEKRYPGSSGVRTSMRPEDLRRVVTTLAKAKKDPKAFMEALQARGIPLTTEVQSIAKEALGRGDASAASGGS